MLKRRVPRSTMVLYSDSVDPQGHGVRLVLAEKNIAVEINYVEQGEHHELLAAVNPYNDILTLMDKELVLYNAQIIMEYLDERFPHPPLLPIDPSMRAENSQFRFRILKDLYSLIDDIKSTNTKKSNNARQSMCDNLTAIAPVFEKKKFFMSDDYTLVDCCMAPLLWRLQEYSVNLPKVAKPLMQYAEKLFERDAFQSSLSNAEEEMHRLKNSKIRF